MSTDSTLENNGYVVLPDGTVARKLKPTITNDKRYWFLSLGGKVVRLSEEQVKQHIKPSTNETK